MAQNPSTALVAGNGQLSWCAKIRVTSIAVLGSVGTAGLLVPRFLTLPPLISVFGAILLCLTLDWLGQQHVLSNISHQPKQQNEQAAPQYEPVDINAFPSPDSNANNASHQPSQQNKQATPQYEPVAIDAFPPFGSYFNADPLTPNDETLAASIATAQNIPIVAAWPVAQNTPVAAAWPVVQATPYYLASQ